MAPVVLWIDELEKALEAPERERIQQQADEAAFARRQGDVDVEVTGRQTASIKTLEWERIHEVLAETDFNISETARRLGMHRRTLARKLEKKRVK